jgi:5-methylcytosine-specific restriction endonuclease McrA
MSYKDYLNSTQWKLLRIEALKRARGLCEHCGAPANAVHHIKYPKTFKDDNINNLVSVCDRCHKLHHGIFDKTDQKEFPTDQDWANVALNCIMVSLLSLEENVWRLTDKVDSLLENTSSEEQ